MNTQTLRITGLMLKIQKFHETLDAMFCTHAKDKFSSEFIGVHECDTNTVV